MDGHFAAITFRVSFFLSFDVMDIQIFAAIYFRENFCLANIAKINRSRNCIGLQDFSCSIRGSIQMSIYARRVASTGGMIRMFFLLFQNWKKNGPLI